MAEKKDPGLSQLKQIGSLTAVPIILVVGPLVGYFLGDRIDQKFQLRPWGTVLFVALGFMAAVREIVRLLKQVLRDDREQFLEDRGRKTEDR